MQIVKITYYYTPIWLRVPYIDLNNILKNKGVPENNMVRERRRYIKILALLTDLKKKGKIRSFQAINLMLLKGSEDVLGDIILSFAKGRAIRYDWVDFKNNSVDFPLHIIIASESTNILTILPLKKNDYESLIAFLRELQISENFIGKKINSYMEI